MRVSEIIQWADLVDAEPSPAEVAAAGLGRSRRRDGALEEIEPADARFSVIYLGWSAETSKLQSISVLVATPEAIEEDELAARFGAPEVEMYPLDAVDHPPQQASFFQGQSGKELCLTLGRTKDGRVESVRVHAVRPLPEP